MKTNIKTISAFTIDAKGGNKAGLVLEADRFSAQQKQRIAFKAGFSETAFVSASKIADFKLEFFTPTKQIAHCGHATIAAFSYMKGIGMIENDTSSKETVDGTRKIFFDKGRAFMEQIPRYWMLAEEKTEISEALGIDVASFRSEPVIVNTGNSFLLVELGTEQELKCIKPDFHIIERISRRHSLVGFYVFVRTPNGQDQATTRMFAPLYGIPEESATGMAAGPLASWLFIQHPEIGNEFSIKQGDFMETVSPSRIFVKLEVENANVRSLYAGGFGSLLDTFEIEI